MYRHLGLQRITVPARLTGGRRHPASPATPNESSAIGFGSAIGLATTTMLVGTAVITAAPVTVTVPLATVLGFGLLASALVAARSRRRTLRR
jgi:hypothetical protein